MTGVSAILAMRGPRFGIRAASGVLAMTVVAPGGFAVWYRLACNEWPGQGPLLACTGADQTRSPSVARRKPGSKITSRERLPVRAVGQYPPLGWSGRALFGAAIPEPRRLSVSPPTPRVMVVCLRTGPDEYQAYRL